MPVITIDMAAVSREKKAELVRTLTSKASEITGIGEGSTQFGMPLPLESISQLVTKAVLSRLVVPFG